MNRIWNKIPIIIQHSVLKEELKQKHSQIEKFIAKLSLVQLCQTLSVHYEKLIESIPKDSIPEDQTILSFLGLNT